MGDHIRRKHFRARTRAPARKGSKRSAQANLLASLVGFSVIFCSMLLFDQRWFGRSAAAAAQSRSWIPGGKDGAPPQDSSAEAVDHSAQDRSPAKEVRQMRFSLCHTGGGVNCVVDGDTFWSEGRKIRIADIDTPETHPARCAAEAELGDRATRRLQELLSAGSFTLISIDRDADKYGRRLRIVERGGSSIGMQLVNEGLARPYAGGYRKGWCA